MTSTGTARQRPARRRDIMAELVNRRITTVVAGLAAVVIIGLNAF